MMRRRSVWFVGLALLAWAGVAQSESTPQYFSYYERSPNPGTIRISNTIKRSNCKRNGHAAKCQWEGQPLTAGATLPKKTAVELKKVLNFPLNPRRAAEIPLPPMLVEVLVHLSNTFSGAQICVVSGYRCADCGKYQKPSSRHIQGKATDIVLLGIDNVDLATYLLYLNETSERFGQRLGVGYYPNQEHVHVDVRERPKYWVDKSSSADPPDYASNSLLPMDAFFQHYDAQRAPSRRGRACPTLSHAENDTASGEPEDTDTSEYRVRWRNVLFTEPPLRGSPSSRRRFRNKKVDFSLLRELDGLGQL